MSKAKKGLRSQVKVSFFARCFGVCVQLSGEPLKVTVWKLLPNI